MQSIIRTSSGLPNNTSISEKRSVISSSNSSLSGSGIGDDDGGIYYRSSITPRQSSLLRNSAPLSPGRRTVEISSSTSYVPIGSNVANSGVTTFKTSREREKKDLQDLNERFANYIEKVRFLEAQNKKLASELDQLRSQWGKETNAVKQMYETELGEARKLIDETNKEKSRLQLRVGQLEEQLDDFQRQLDEAKKWRAQDRDVINKLNQQLSELEGEIRMLRRSNESLETERVRDKGTIAKLQEELEKLRIDLSNETIARLDAENKYQTLLEEIQFLKDVHEQELKELSALAYRDTTAENREFWKNELSQAIRDMQQEYDLKVDQIRGEMESFYNLKVQEFRTGATKQNMEVAHSREETKKLHKQLSDARGRMSDLEARNALLEKQYQDLMRELELKEQDHDAECNSLREEMNKLRADMEGMLVELQTLMDAKLSLELEIAAYRKLLECEETRIPHHPSVWNPYRNKDGSFSKARPKSSPYSTTNAASATSPKHNISNARTTRSASPVRTTTTTTPTTVKPMVKATASLVSADKPTSRVGDKGVCDEDDVDALGEKKGTACGDDSVFVTNHTNAGLNDADVDDDVDGDVGVDYNDGAHEKMTMSSPSVTVQLEPNKTSNSVEVEEEIRPQVSEKIEAAPQKEMLEDDYEKEKEMLVLVEKQNVLNAHSAPSSDRQLDTSAYCTEKESSDFIVEGSDDLLDDFDRVDEIDGEIETISTHCPGQVDPSRVNEDGGEALAYEESLNESAPKSVGDRDQPGDVIDTKPQTLLDANVVDSEQALNDQDEFEIIVTDETMLMTTVGSTESGLKVVESPHDTQSESAVEKTVQRETEVRDIHEEGETPIQTVEDEINGTSNVSKEDEQQMERNEEGTKVKSDAGFKMASPVEKNKMQEEHVDSSKSEVKHFEHSKFDVADQESKEDFEIKTKETTDTDKNLDEDIAQKLVKSVVEESMSVTKMSQAQPAVDPEPASGSNVKSENEPVSSSAIVIEETITATNRPDVKTVPTSEHGSEPVNKAESELDFKLTSDAELKSSPTSSANDTSPSLLKNRDSERDREILIERPVVEEVMKAEERVLEKNGVPIAVKLQKGDTLQKDDTFQDMKEDSVKESNTVDVTAKSSPVNENMETPSHVTSGTYSTEVPFAKTEEPLNVDEVERKLSSEIKASTAGSTNTVSNYFEEKHSREDKLVDSAKGVSNESIMSDNTKESCDLSVSDKPEPLAAQSIKNDAVECTIKSESNNSKDESVTDKKLTTEKDTVSSETKTSEVNSSTTEAKPSTKESLTLATEELTPTGEVQEVSNESKSEAGMPSIKPVTILSNSETLENVIKVPENEVHTATVESAVSSDSREKTPVTEPVVPESSEVKNDSNESTTYSSETSETITRESGTIESREVNEIETVSTESEKNQNLTAESVNSSFDDTNTSVTKSATNESKLSDVVVPESKETKTSIGDSDLAPSGEVKTSTTESTTTASKEEISITENKDVKSPTNESTKSNETLVSMSKSSKDETTGRECNEMKTTEIESVPVTLNETSTPVVTGNTSEMMSSTASDDALSSKNKILATESSDTKPSVVESISTSLNETKHSTTESNDFKTETSSGVSETYQPADVKASATETRYSALEPEIVASEAVTPEVRPATSLGDPSYMPEIESPNKSQDDSRPDNLAVEIDDEEFLLGEGACEDLIEASSGDVSLVEPMAKADAVSSHAWHSKTGRADDTDDDVLTCDDIIMDEVVTTDQGLIIIDGQTVNACGSDKESDKSRSITSASLDAEKTTTMQNHDKDSSVKDEGCEKVEEIKVDNNAVQSEITITTPASETKKESTKIETSSNAATEIVIKKEETVTQTESAISKLELSTEVTSLQDCDGAKPIIDKEGGIQVDAKNDDSDLNSKMETTAKGASSTAVNNQNDKEKEDITSNKTEKTSIVTLSKSERESSSSVSSQEQSSEMRVVDSVVSDLKKPTADITMVTESSVQGVSGFESPDASGSTQVMIHRETNIVQSSSTSHTSKIISASSSTSDPSVEFKEGVETNTIHIQENKTVINDKDIDGVRVEERKVEELKVEEKSVTQNGETKLVHHSEKSETKVEQMSNNDTKPETSAKSESVASSTETITTSLASNSHTVPKEN